MTVRFKYKTNMTE